MIDAAGITSGAAWREVCNRLATMGEEILGAGWPADERGRIEGTRHLATQVACWFTYATGHSDPERPQFFRSADPTYAWGGPNVDQVARRAAIDGSGTYRVSGRMGSCEEFILQIKGGAVQSGGAEIATEVSASGLGLGPGDSFEILVSADEQPGTWLRAGPGPGFVHVRDYYFDWVAAEPATFVIERLDTQGTSAPAVSADRVAEMLETALHEVEHSSVYFRDLQARMRAAQAPNRFGVPDVSGRGVQDIIYSHGFVSLASEEALILELDPAAAALWGVSSYTPTWYEPLDYATRVTSRNHRQVTADSDGLVRVVIAAVDTGTPNWLDTAGRPDLLTTVRWFRPPEPPPIRSEVVPLAALDQHLPDDHPRVDPASRAAELRRRAAHVSWRYRT